MKSPLAWIALVLVLAGAAGLHYWRSVGGAQTPPPPPPPVAAAPAAAPRPEPQRILHPLPEPPAGNPALPALADSDRVVGNAAEGLFGRDAFAHHFYPDGLVRRFVATVDNLPRKTAAVRLMPVKPVPGAFAVKAGNGDFTVAPDNAWRYRPYIVAMEAADAKRIAAAYLRFYPLFQSAYRELGYPDGYFNDRLVFAIDDLLAAPDADGARLIQPKIVYAFADAGLEQRSAGQKIMLRMGSANAARVKDKLRAIRRELTGQMAHP